MLKTTPGMLDVHLLYFQTGQVHTVNDVREQANHIVIAHGHVGDDSLKSYLLSGMVLVLLATAA